MVRQGAKGRPGSVESNGVNGAEERAGSRTGYVDVEKDKIAAKSPS